MIDKWGKHSTSCLVNNFDWCSAANLQNLEVEVYSLEWDCLAIMDDSFLLEVLDVIVFLEIIILRILQYDILLQYRSPDFFAV